MSLKKGDIVYLIQNNKHILGLYNPARGTKFECKGIIVDVVSNYLIVRWNNKTINIYDEEDLELAEKWLQNNNPNSMFKRRE